MNIPFELFVRFCNCHLHSQCLHSENIEQTCQLNLCPLVEQAKRMVGKETKNCLCDSCIKDAKCYVRAMSRRDIAICMQYKSHNPSGQRLRCICKRAINQPLGLIIYQVNMDCPEHGEYMREY